MNLIQRAKEWFERPTKEAEKHREAIKAHWEEEDAAFREAERTRNLCVLTAASLGSLSACGHGCGPDAMRAAVVMADYMLERIENNVRTVGEEELKEAQP